MKDASEDYDIEALTRMASAFSLYQFFLHCWSAILTRDPRMFLMHGMAFLYDVFLLSMTVVGLKVVRRFFFRPRRRALDMAAKVVMLAMGLLLASYPFLLVEFLGFPVNVFAVGYGAAGFSLYSIIGSKGTLAMAAAGAIGIVSLLCSFQIPLLQKKLLFWILASICLWGIILSLAKWKFMAIHPHPLVYSVQESVKEWVLRSKRVVPRPERPSMSEGKRPLSLNSSPLEAAATFRYDHVLLLVMETVNESHFAQDFLGRKDGFYSKVKDQASYFSRYYATNLDSYPSLLAMLTSMQIPYRAYEAPGYFNHLNEAPNMITTLGSKGWKSLYICTSEHLAFVPLPDLWDSMVHGRDLPHQGWVSLSLNPIEAAVEDKAAIPSIISFMKASHQTVILHEMVFGHSPRWRTLTGKEQLEYYDEFFRELYDRVQKARLADTTLFVIVADHGDRTDSAIAENYHIPLLLVGEGVEHAINNGMFSHLDLQRIIGHYLCGLPLPMQRKDILVIGHSGRWVYGQITNDGRFMFIDALDGVVLSQKGDLLPKDLFDHFQMKINLFAHFQGDH